MSPIVNQPKNVITPLQQSERIIALNSLRGVAVLHTT